ncbi:MAG TPA: polymer-forming cytoskeletal protein [Patescibacteria group bacterium]|nr:polymer-forming cytoskeletal protein [Patescibacteria group bacterium]
MTVGSHKNTSLKRFWLTAVLILAYVAIGPQLIFAHEAELISDKVEQDVIINNQDGSVTIPVAGDLMLASKDVTVDSPVAGDVLVLGRNVSINNTIGGSVRSLAQTVHIDGRVERNITIAAQNIEITRESNVLGSVYAAGGSVAIAGNIEGSVWIWSRSVIITGKVQGNLRINAKQIRFENGAEVEGTVTYQSPTIPQVADSAKLGKVVRSEDDWFPGVFHRTPVVRFLLAFIHLLSLLLAAFVLWKIFPRIVSGLVDKREDRYRQALLSGAISLLVVPVGLGILAITIIGLPLSILGFLIWGIMLYFGSITGFLFLGASVLEYAHQGDPGGVFPLRALLVGIVIAVLVGFVPVLGEIFQLLVWLWGYGTLLDRLLVKIK